MAIQGIQQTKYSNKRRKVVATADVAIQQVQVVDKTGQIRSIVLWRCGPDVLYAETLDGLFDSQRRKKAPEWLVTQLAELADSQKFDAEGVAKAGAKPAAPVDAPAHLPVSDSDAPDFVQG